MGRIFRNTRQKSVSPLRSGAAGENKLNKQCSGLPLAAQGSNHFFKADARGGTQLRGDTHRCGPKR